MTGVAVLIASIPPRVTMVKINTLIWPQSAQRPEGGGM